MLSTYVESTVYQPTHRSFSDFQPTSHNPNSLPNAGPTVCPAIPGRINIMRWLCLVVVTKCKWLKSCYQNPSWWLTKHTNITWASWDQRANNVPSGECNYLPVCCRGNTLAHTTITSTHFSLHYWVWLLHNWQIIPLMQSPRGMSHNGRGCSAVTASFDSWSPFLLLWETHQCDQFR